MAGGEMNTLEPCHGNKASCAPQRGAHFGLYGGRAATTFRIQIIAVNLTQHPLARNTGRLQWTVTYGHRPRDFAASMPRNTGRLQWTVTWTRAKFPYAIFSSISKFRVSMT